MHGKDTQQGRAFNRIVNALPVLLPNKIYYNTNIAQY